MKSFFTKSGLPLTVLTAVFAAALSAVIPAATPAADGYYAYSHTAQELPLSPESGRTSERESVTGKGILPGIPVSLTTSRRNYEPPFQRILRDGNNGTIGGEITLITPVFRAENHKNHSHFSFQSFLRHSLPVRAGPHLA